MTVLFVSDLHLHPDRPGATSCFIRFLRTEARTGTRLYILGDLFDAWIGDDAAEEWTLRVTEELRELADGGIPVGLVRGNRDFLLGADFAARAGVALLPDEAVVRVADETVLLMHGDTLCTADRAYQRYRRVVRNPSLQRAFLRMPTGVRRAIAGWFRGRSRAANARKPRAIMDVAPPAVSDAMKRHGVTTLLHGHTHRPGIYQFMVANTPARRIVLGDWYEQGSVLRWTASGPELATLTWS